MKTEAFRPGAFGDHPGLTIAVFAAYVTKNVKLTIKLPNHYRSGLTGNDLAFIGWGRDWLPLFLPGQ